jgi:hypothetical protein
MPDKIWLKLTKPPWRTILLAVAVIAVLAGIYTAWSPGKAVTTGRHDRKANGIWLQHGWLGDDTWFTRNSRDTGLFRSEQKIRALADKLLEHNIRYVYPHLCPCLSSGEIAPVDPDQTELFLNVMTNHDVLPWVGGVLDVHAFPDDKKWRQTFIDSVVRLLTTHSRLAGIHINIEPMPVDNEGFITLLTDLKKALPEEKILSVAAYPPPTRWHKFPDVHWDEAYFRSVASKVDQMVVMMYDTAIQWQKIYVNLMVTWTKQCLLWSNDTDVLLGLPTYDDADSGYHNPDVENLHNALLGIHGALGTFEPLPGNYAGIALYCEWEMDAAEWDYLKLNFNSCSGIIGTAR